MQRIVTLFIDTFSFLFGHVVPFELLVFMCFLDELQKRLLLLLHGLTNFASLLLKPLFKCRCTYAVLFWANWARL